MNPLLAEFSVDQIMLWAGWGLAILLGAALVGFVFEFLWDRREKRRGGVFDTVLELVHWGFPPEFFTALGISKAYVIGNYLGPGSLAQKGWQLAQIMRDKTRMLELLGKLFWNLLAAARENDKVRQEVIDFMQSPDRHDTPAAAAKVAAAPKPSV